ncbi:hypothetical protein EX895_002373 [Sporisorium graminicola]|uniref:Zn(2)-C6 fungal-type domain-containing protein n=1 Tax=Sporisorium graminicola TaxID=280036 RepID=A0A4U7L0N0_9BASI|nr:hypothetical protein EX895_002373 [Sporisorium graminicola]TKY88742.1 hypothetical protein EX895_002373 [Sporisorium graminicola]
MPPTSQPHASTSATPSASTTASERKTKRKRVSRACDQCFLKKDRCDGLQPICTFCSKLERTCTYDRPERKRGPTQGLRPRLEQRIAALETVLGFVLSQTGESAVRVDQFKQASEQERSKWRKEGWWKSGVRKQLEVEFGLKDDLVSVGSSVKHSPAAASTPTDLDHSAKHDDSESDYSEVDLSLPPTHQTQPSTSSSSTNTHPALHQPNSSSTTNDAQRDHHNHSDSDSDHDGNGPHHFTLPLLSSGKGGSSLNRGLVPRGADPNAALGGFEIEFGGNQTDEDWVRSFVPPSHSRRPNPAPASDTRHGGSRNGATSKQ